MSSHTLKPTWMETLVFGLIVLCTVLWVGHYGTNPIPSPKEENYPEWEDYIPWYQTCQECEQEWTVTYPVVDSVDPPTVIQSCPRCKPSIRQKRIENIPHLKEKYDNHRN